MSLSQSVSDRINREDMGISVNPSEVQGIIDALDAEEQSVLEIAKEVKMPTGKARVILTFLSEEEGSPVIGKHMRFKQAGSISNEPAPSPDKSKKTIAVNPNEIQKTISTIIEILHSRPQTLDSLADELDVDENTCIAVIKKLETEGAIVSEKSDDWGETIYQLDQKGYADFTERHKAKVSNSIASPEQPSQDMQIENVVKETIKRLGEAKVNQIVKETHSGITKMHIESAISRLIEKGEVKPNNPKRKHPIYLLVETEDAASQESAEKKTAEATSKKTASKSVTTAKPARKVDTQKSQSETKVVKSEATNTTVKPTATETLFPVTSENSDVAALQIALMDVLPQLNALKQDQIQSAIGRIEAEKKKVKDALLSMNKAITDLV